MQTMNEVFTNFLTNGLFTYLNEQNVPWSETVSADMLNLAYHGGHSGQKNISSLVRSIKDSETLSDSEREILAVTLVSMFGTNWTKLWETLSFVYDPIENYRMIETMENDTTTVSYGKTETRTDNLSALKTGTETETKNLTDAGTNTKSGTDTKNIDLDDEINRTKTGTEIDTKDLTDTDNKTKTGTETETKNLTDTRTPNLTTNTTESVWGFNSDSAVNANKTAQTASGTEQETHTGTDATQYNLSESDTLRRTGTDEMEYDLTENETVSHTGTEETEYDTTETETINHTGTDTMQYNVTQANTGTQANASGGEDVTEHGYELTRSGNIGVTTSQQMIESERALWVWNFFYDTVFPDIDKMLTLSVY